MEKVRYETDPFNRLIITGRTKGLPRQRAVLDGVFKAGPGQSLVYHIKSPSAGPAEGPHQVKLRGSWSLTKDHNLRFTLDRWKRRGPADYLELSGDIIDARGNALLFSMTTRRSDGSQTTYVLELGGAWQAGKDNRLTFRVARSGGPSDLLVFEGGWELGRDNEILYRYERARLAKKTRSVHTIQFNGRWRIGGKGVLSYALDAASSSSFDFKTSLGICGGDYLKYEIGIGMGGRRKPLTRTVSLFGAWNIAKGTGLTFEVERQDGMRYAISFGARARLTARDTVQLSLKDLRGRTDLGMSVELSHALLEGDGSAFLQFLASRDETAVFVGAGFRW